MAFSWPCSLVRDGRIRDRDSHDAEERIDELAAASRTVINVAAVKAQARRLLRLHPLRASDALQLGAACEWAGRRPAGRVFHCLDSRLGLALGEKAFGSSRHRRNDQPTAKN